MNHKLETKPDAPEAPLQLAAIPIEQITTSPHQARKVFDEDLIKTLAESMRQEGLIQPITVRTVTRAEDPELHKTDLSADNAKPQALTPQSWELISGERRLRAARLLNWKTIPARIIQTISAGEAAAKGLIENLQREDLNPIDEAEGFYHLNKLSPDYWDQNQIAKVTGRTQGYVSQSISMLKLAPDIQENIRRLILTRSLGLEIGRLDDHNLQRMVVKSLGKNQTVKAARKLVDEALGWRSRKEKRRTQIDPLAEAWSKLYADTTLPQHGSCKVIYKEGIWRLCHNIFISSFPAVAGGESIHVVSRFALSNAFKHTVDEFRKVVPIPMPCEVLATTFPPQLKSLSWRY